MPAWSDTFLLATHRAGIIWRARRAVPRLRGHPDFNRQTLAAALQDMLEPLSPEEAAWIDRIERLRRTVLRDATPLTFLDHGVPHRLRGSSEEVPSVTRPVGEVCRASVPPHEARLLFHLVRRFRPATCLELGTCLGLSAAYLAAAQTLNGTGRLITLEGGAAVAACARQHLGALGLRQAVVRTGRFQDTLPEVLATHAPIDFAFIDGHHDPGALQHYFRQIAPHLAAGAVVGFDDIFWTTGMRRAWKTLAADATVSVDLLAVGVCIF